jgi:hypothetical protein
MVSRRLVSGSLLVSCVLAGLVACAPFGDAGSLPKGGRYPDACAQWAYPARRCGAIVARAAATAGVDRHAATSIDLLPFDRMAGLEPGQVRLGGGQVALVGFTFADRPSVTQDVWCVGVAQGLACNEDAEIYVFSGVDRDVTCAGEPPTGCATLPPMPDPDAIAAAEPFRLASLRHPDPVLRLASSRRGSPHRHLGRPRPLASAAHRRPRVRNLEAMGFSAVHEQALYRFDPAD